MSRSVWDWLGIEPTGDKNEIKKAYSEMAKKYHPAEYPEEFQMLRDAYKRALKMADGRSGGITEQKYPEYEPQSKLRSEIPTKTEKPEYEFNVDAMEDYRFSKRQKAMFTFYVDLLNSFKQYADRYRSEKFFEEAFRLWTEDIYKAEITPEFAASVLDLLDMGSLLHPSFYEVLDKVLFEGRDGEEYQRQRTRLETFKAETGLIAWKKPGIVWKVLIQNMFVLAMEDATPVRIGYLFDEGIFKKHPRKKLFFSKGILFSFKRKVRCYLICDCTCTINKRTNDLIVRDVYGKKLFHMPSTHGYYYYVLKHLTENGCNMVYSGKPDLSNFTSEFNLDAAPFHKLAFDGRYNRLLWQALRKSAFLGFIFILQYILFGLLFSVDAGSVFYLPASLIKGINTPLIWITGFFLFIFLIIDLVLTAHIIGNLSTYLMFQRECKDGTAIYDIGNRMFVFKEYVVNPVNRDYIRLSSVIHLEPLTKTEKYGNGFLKIGFNNGVYKDYFVGYSETAMALYKEIKKRWDACEKDPSTIKVQSDPDEIRQRMQRERKLVNLRSKKHSIFKRQFLVDQDIKNLYDMNMMLMMGAVVYSVVVFFGIFVDKWELSTAGFIFIMVIFIALAALFIVKLGALKSFMKTDNELLLDACLQLRKPGVYTNLLYKINLLEDYFMSTYLGVIRIIPYKDMEWIKMDHSDTQGYMIVIKVYGKDPEKFCMDRPSERNEKQVSEIYSMMRNMHPEIKVFKEE